MKLGQIRSRKEERRREQLFLAEESGSFYAMITYRYELP